MSVGILVAIVIAMVLFNALANRVVSASPMLLASYAGAIGGIYLNLQYQLTPLLIPLFLLLPAIALWGDLDAILKEEAHFSRFVKQEVRGTTVTTYDKRWKIGRTAALRVSLLRLCRDGVVPSLAYLFSFAFHREVGLIVTGLLVSYALISVVVYVLGRAPSPMREWHQEKAGVLLCLCLASVSLLFAIPLAIRGIPLYLYFEPYFVVGVSGKVHEVRSVVQSIHQTPFLPFLIALLVLVTTLVIGGYLSIRRIKRGRGVVLLAAFGLPLVAALGIWWWVANDAYKHSRFVLGNPGNYSASTVLRSVEYTAQYVNSVDTELCPVFCYADRWGPRVDKTRAQAAILRIINSRSDTPICALECVAKWSPYVKTKEASSAIVKIASAFRPVKVLALVLALADSWMPSLPREDLAAAVEAMAKKQPEAFIEQLTWARHFPPELAIERLLRLPLRDFQRKHPEKLVAAWHALLERVDRSSRVQILREAAVQYAGTLLTSSRYWAPEIDSADLVQFISSLVGSQPQLLVGGAASWVPLLPLGQAAPMLEAALAKASPRIVLQSSLEWQPYIEPKKAEAILKAARDAERLSHRRGGSPFLRFPR